MERNTQEKKLKNFCCAKKKERKRKRIPLVYDKCKDYDTYTHFLLLLFIIYFYGKANNSEEYTTKARGRKSHRDLTFITFPAFPFPLSLYTGKKNIYIQHQAHNFYLNFYCDFFFSIFISCHPTPSFLPRYFNNIAIVPASRYFYLGLTL